VKGSQPGVIVERLLVDYLVFTTLPTLFTVRDWTCVELPLVRKQLSEVRVSSSPSTMRARGAE